jgi:hypothetical protein
VVPPPDLPRALGRLDGDAPSKQHMILLGWHILVSNLATDWTVEDIFKLYPVRWQVELVFKSWKSYLTLVPNGSAYKQ